MKAIILPCTPAECEKIVNGDMSILVRKKVPKESNLPIKVFIYCIKPRKKYQHICGCLVLNSDQLYRHPTQGIKYGDSIELMACDNYSRDNFLNGKVIGYFICHTIKQMAVRDCEKACMSLKEAVDYAKGKPLYGLHISELKIYDKPKELSEFRACNFKSMNDTDVCGNYDCKYYQDSGSYMIPPSCAKNGCRVIRPPKNYIYVEE